MAGNKKEILGKVKSNHQNLPQACDREIFLKTGT